MDAFVLFFWNEARCFIGYDHMTFGWFTFIITCIKLTSHFNVKSTDNRVTRVTRCNEVAKVSKHVKKKQKKTQKKKQKNTFMSLHAACWQRGSQCNHWSFVFALFQETSHRELLLL